MFMVSIKSKNMRENLLENYLRKFHSVNYFTGLFKIGSNSQFCLCKVIFLLFKMKRMLRYIILPQSQTHKTKEEHNL